MRGEVGGGGNPVCCKFRIASKNYILILLRVKVGGGQISSKKSGLFLMNISRKGKKKRFSVRWSEPLIFLCVFPRRADIWIFG